MGKGTEVMVINSKSKVCIIICELLWKPLWKRNDTLVALSTDLQDQKELKWKKKMRNGIWAGWYEICFKNQDFW